MRRRTIGLLQSSEETIGSLGRWILLLHHCRKEALGGSSSRIDAQTQELRRKDSPITGTPAATRNDACKPGVCLLDELRFVKSTQLNEFGANRRQFLRCPKHRLGTREPHKPLRRECEGGAGVVLQCVQGAVRFAG